MSLEVKIIIGELPSFWNRGAIFFVNLHSLFFDNIGLKKVLEREIRGVSTYGGRVVPILNLLFRKGQNLIFLESSLNEALLQYLTGTLGITLPEIEVLPRRKYAFLKKEIGKNNFKAIEPFIDRVRSCTAEYIDGYATDSVLIAIAGNAGKLTVSSVEGSKKGNNKYLLYRHLCEKKLPVFDSFEAYASGDIIPCLKRLKDSGYKKAVLKSQIGASGCGLLKYDTVDFSRKSFPKYLFFEGPCLVQGWLNEDISGVRRWGSPSVQMFLSEDELSLFDITEQLLKEESIHEGNISPPAYLKGQPEIRQQLLRQASEAGRWLHAQGYRGTASTDFLVVEKNGRNEIIICEINARITGATYPSVLARHFLPQGAWLMRNLRFPTPLAGAELLAKLKQSALLFKRGSEKGVLPFNFNLNQEGKVNKGQFVFLGAETKECENLLKQVQTIFPLVCKFDRD